MQCARLDSTKCRLLSELAQLSESCHQLRDHSPDSPRSGPHPEASLDPSLEKTLAAAQRGLSFMGLFGSGTLQHVKDWD